MINNEVTQSGEILKSGVRGFDALIGSEIQLIEPGKAVFSLRVEEKHLNPMGSLHGGVLLTMADTAAGCACAYEPTVCPALEGKLNFLEPCFLDDMITVEGRELRHGKTILSCEVKAWNQRGTLVAAGLFSYIISRKPMPREETP